MAGRNKSYSADYFSHDADASSDEKIMYLESKFGHTGYALYFKLLERMARSDNFELCWDEIKISIYASEFGISVTEMESFIKECCRKEIKAFILKSKKLYSKGLKNRMKPLIEKREYNRKKYDEKISKKNKELANSVTGKSLKITEITQSKVKESKGKETKRTLFKRLKDYLIEKIPKELETTKEDILSFFKYRMEDTIKGKKQPYETTAGIDGLIRDLKVCVGEGYNPIECCNIAKQNGWLTPRASYFKNIKMNNKTPFRTETKEERDKEIREALA